MYATNDIFGILVIVSVNVINRENCKYKKKLVDKLVEECTETVEEVKIDSKNEHKNKCSSCTLYIVLFPMTFTIYAGIAT